MSKPVNKNQKSNSSRRSFLKTGGAVAAGITAAGLATPSLSLARSANVAGRDTIKLGLIGCGGRGTGAAIQAMNTSSSNVELHAVADVFENRQEQCLEQCATEHKDKTLVKAKSKFVGLEAYKQVLDSDIDLVIMATPPGFRPLHFEAAINAGKHVFMEKPVGVDAPGIRRVLESAAISKEKGLYVQVGLQRRHERAYRETIAQLKDGIIGDLIASRVYWNNDGVWNRPRKEEDSELEYQLRNWYYFNWLCGDHIVEQHIHNLDVINWLMDGFPVSAQGQGGRLVRTGKTNGEIFDHHSVEYTYENGHKMFSMCRHMPKCWSKVSEFVHGANGWADIAKGEIYDPKGKVIFKCQNGEGQRAGHQQEHHDLFADIANGVYVNEAEYGAKSTFTAILGRLATYSGKELMWDDMLANSPSLCDVDEMVDFKQDPPILPLDDGSYEIARPGTGAKRILGENSSVFPKKKKKEEMGDKKK